MANNQVEKGKEPRLFLRKLFTLGWESREYVADDRQPPRAKPPRLRPYADGVSGAFKAWRGESKKLLWASIFFLIFLLPLDASPLRQKRNDRRFGVVVQFMGNIGIGHHCRRQPAASPRRAVRRLQIFFLYFTRARSSSRAWRA